MSGSRDKILEIIAARAAVDVRDVTESSKLADLGLDSLDQVEILFSVEEAFDIAIPFNANTPDGADVGGLSVAMLFATVEGLILQNAQ